MNTIQLSGHLADDVLNMTASWPHYHGNIALFDLVTESGIYSCRAYSDSPAIMNLKKGDYVSVEGTLKNKTGHYPQDIRLLKLSILDTPAIQVSPRNTNDGQHCALQAPSASTCDNKAEAPSSEEKDNLDKTIEFKFIKL